MAEAIVNEAERHKLKEKEDFYCHWINKIEESVGLVSLDHRKDLELDYKTTKRAEDYWKSAKDETNPESRERLSQQGFDCLRKTYEAFVLCDLFGGTVKRFDRQIKYGTFKDIFCPKEAVNFVHGKLSYCSGFISGHLQADGYAGPSATPELLKSAIDEFIKFKSDYKSKKSEERKNEKLTEQQV